MIPKCDNCVSLGSRGGEPICNNPQNAVQSVYSVQIKGYRIPTVAPYVLREGVCDLHEARPVVVPPSMDANLYVVDRNPRKRRSFLR